MPAKKYKIGPMVTSQLKMTWCMIPGIDHSCMNNTGLENTSVYSWWNLWSVLTLDADFPVDLKMVLNNVNICNYKAKLIRIYNNDKLVYLT